MMNDGRLRKIFGVSLVVVLAALATSCDGLLKLQGRVYTQRPPGPASKLFLDQTPSDDLTGLVPLEGAKVTLYDRGDYEKLPADLSTQHGESTSTDSSGRFEIGDVVAPTKFHAVLVVEKPGFKSVTQVFPHEGKDHTAVVILAPDEQSGKSR